MDSVDGTESELPSFDDWIKSRPKWLQTAASKMLPTLAVLGSDEIDELTKLCIAEAQASPNATYGTATLGGPDNSLASAGMQLSAIRKVAGVNAIKYGAELEFGDAKLVVVYGSNGSGKSGYSRLIK